MKSCCFTTRIIVYLVKPHLLSLRPGGASVGSKWRDTAACAAGLNFLCRHPESPANIQGIGTGLFLVAQLDGSTGPGLGTAQPRLTLALSSIFPNPLEKTWSGGFEGKCCVLASPAWRHTPWRCSPGLSEPPVSSSELVLGQASGIRVQIVSQVV